MVAADDELGSVTERDAISGLDRGPVGEHRCLDVAAVVASPLGPIDLVADAEFLDALCSSIGHQDRGLTPAAEGTCMTASPVRIDGPGEGHRVARHVVDDRLGLDFDELDAPEFGGVHLGPAELEKPIVFHGRVDPTIEHTFGSGKRHCS
jgi:hypothetical protein